jgi:hypothetical protein
MGCSLANKVNDAPAVGSLITGKGGIKGAGKSAMSSQIQIQKILSSSDAID